MRLKNLCLLWQNFQTYSFLPHVPKEPTPFVAHLAAVLYTMKRLKTGSLHGCYGFFFYVYSTTFLFSPSLFLSFSLSLLLSFVSRGFANLTWSFANLPPSLSLFSLSLSLSFPPPPGAREEGSRACRNLDQTAADEEFSSRKRKILSQTRGNCKKRTRFREMSD
jgi:hypothetical protein